MPISLRKYVGSLRSWSQPFILRRRIAGLFSLCAWPFAAGVARLCRTTRLRRNRIVAVVGSLGKTTTARAVATALDCLGTSSSGPNAFSRPALAVLRLKPGDGPAVIEVGIGGRHQMAGYGRTLQPDVVVVTSIGSEHHRSLGTLEVTRQEKARMVEALRPGGVAVLNGDDPNVMWMKERTSGRVVTFGFGAACDVRARDLTIELPGGTTFVLEAAGSGGA